jgi:hypothetical protein
MVTLIAFWAVVMFLALVAVELRNAYEQSERARERERRGL